MSPNQCTGSCNAGRPCDCEAAIPEDLPEPLTRGEQALVLIIRAAIFVLTISGVAFVVGVATAWTRRHG